ncbi:hypothetical protein PIB30_051673 [Stylosanthes scabra]|uniref:Uncharacterized protein n=1 Tax=Stylosanthes scabra TaxID=79078 RepID=A0ABU6SHT9_9FABA|nr:hypothetical protein [Stylosanthes scabra]
MVVLPLKGMMICKYCFIAKNNFRRNQREPDVRLVASPSFYFNLQAKATTGEDELGDSHSFAEFGVAIAATSQSLAPQAFQVVPDPDPQVNEALRPHDSDDEPQFIKEDTMMMMSVLFHYNHLKEARLAQAHNSNRPFVES